MIYLDASTLRFQINIKDVAMEKQIRTEFIDTEEYCALVLSRRNLQRSDDDGEGQRSLIDLDNGIRYVVLDSPLFADEDDSDAVLSDVLG